MPPLALSASLVMRTFSASIHPNAADKSRRALQSAMAGYIFPGQSGSLAPPQIKGWLYGGCMVAVWWLYGGCMVAV